LTYKGNFPLGILLSGCFATPIQLPPPLSVPSAGLDPNDPGNPGLLYSIYREVVHIRSAAHRDRPDQWL